MRKVEEGEELVPPILHTSFVVGRPSSVLPNVGQKFQCVVHVVLTTPVAQIPNFWDIAPFSPLKSMDYSSTLKMEAACFSEMSVVFKQTKWPYIPEECRRDNYQKVLHDTNDIRTLAAYT
jgi:hypothetical protein